MLVMIIDGHAHACGTYFNSERIIKYLDSHGIDKVILCAGEPESNSVLSRHYSVTDNYVIENNIVEEKYVYVQVL